MSKPVFDPNQPFESSAKPAFDPNAPFTPGDQTQQQPQGSLYDRFSSGAQDLLNKAADVSQTAQNATIGNVVKGVAYAAKAGSRAAFGTEAPANALGRAIAYIPQKIDQAGQYVAEKGAQMFPNLPGVIPAAAGMAVSNLPYMLIPGGKIEGTIAKPIIPAERLAAVQAAKEAAVPLSRAEMTGGKFATGTENFLEKTPLGAIPMNQARAAGDTAMQAYKDRLLNQMGTPAQNYDVGANAIQSQAARDAAMKGTRDQMFNAIPENVHIPLNEARNTADTIMQEQSQYLPTTRNGDVLSIAKDVQNAHQGISSGIDVGPNPTKFGETYSASPGASPLPVVPGATTGQPHALFDYNDPITGKSSYKINGNAEQLGYKTTPNVPIETVQSHNLQVLGKTQKAADLGHEPLDLPNIQNDATSVEPKPNFQLLKRLRETLSGKAQDARNSGNFAAERDYLRLKSSVDSDIDNYVQGQNTPLGSMMGQEFADSYQKANAFSGAYKQLFKGDLANKIADSPPEKILDSVFQKNNETAIKQFRALVGDQAFQQAKSKWVSDLLDSPNVSQALSDKKIDPGTLNAILTPQEQQTLSKYGAVQGLRKTVGNLQGTNGSARSNVHTGSLLTGGAALAALFHGNLPEAAALGGSLLAPYPLAKAATSRAATEGINYTIPEAARKAAYADFISRVTTKDNQQ